MSKSRRPDDRAPCSRRRSHALLPVLDSAVPRIHVVARFLSCIVTEWVGGKGESPKRRVWPGRRLRRVGAHTKFPDKMEVIHARRTHETAAAEDSPLPPTHSVTMQERKRWTTWIRGTVESGATCSLMHMLLLPCRCTGRSGRRLNLNLLGRHVLGRLHHHEDAATDEEQADDGADDDANDGTNRQPVV